MTSSPEVYYEKEKYPYTINYYKDSISQDNYSELLVLFRA